MLTQDELLKHLEDARLYCLNTSPEAMFSADPNLWFVKCDDLLDQIREYIRSSIPKPKIIVDTDCEGISELSVNDKYICDTGTSLVGTNLRESLGL